MRLLDAESDLRTHTGVYVYRDLTSFIANSKRNVITDEYTVYEISASNERITSDIQ